MKKSKKGKKKLFEVWFFNLFKKVKVLVLFGV